MKFRTYKKEVRKEVDNIEIASMSEEVKNKAKAVALDSPNHKTKYSFGRKQIVVLTMCTVAILLIVFASITIFSSNNNNILLASNIARPVGSQTNLKKIVESSKRANRNGDFLVGLFDFGTAKTANGIDIAEEGLDGTSSVAPNSPDSTSQTISQVDGIQEGEIIKCDGNHIYYAYLNKVQIYEAENGKTTKVKDIELDNRLYHYGIVNNESTYYTQIQMYITDKYLLVMYEEVKNVGNISPYYFYWGGYSNNTFTTILEIYDKTNFELAKQIRVPGRMNDGRVYNGFVYFVSTETIVDYEIASVTEKTKDNTTVNEFDYNDVIYVPSYVDYPYENYICSVNLDTLDANYECQLGSVNFSTIYMSENALYLCNNCYDNGNPYEVIYKYEIDKDGFLKFSASGKVNGSFLNQYCLDEYNGYLRCVTTGRFYNRISDVTIINAIYVLKEKEDKTLEIVSKLDEGIGEVNEQVKSVKFNGEYVSVVTYLQTDPLYLIKFTDDTKIEIVDYLKVPGYSTYLLDITIDGGHYKIGVGETDNNGYKISLYKEENDEVSQIGDDYVIKTHKYEFDNDIETQYYYYTSITTNIRTMFLYQDSDNNTFIGFNLDCYKYTFTKHDKSQYMQVGGYVLLRVELDTEEALVKFGEFETNSYESRMVAINGYYYLVSLDQAQGYKYNSTLDTFDVIE